MFVIRYYTTVIKNKCFNKNTLNFYYFNFQPFAYHGRYAMPDENQVRVTGGVNVLTECLNES